MEGARWASLFAVSLTAIVLLLTVYTSISVYGIVRESVSQATNLPSFEVLSRQAGMNLNQPIGSSRLQGSLPAASMTEEGNSQSNAEAPLEVELPDERINILILGIDQRQGEAGPSRSDTIILLTIDPLSGTAGMLSIPRDLWVPIPGYGENRINTAHFLGDLRKYPGGGPALAKKTVSYNFGIPVHYYVRLNFEGFQRIVDTIGGIDIDVPKEIRDDRFPDEEDGYEPLYVPAGLVHMDGELALKYARTRKADSDFHRAHRQQQVIVAIKDKVMNLNLLPSLIPKLPELSSQLSDAVQTDIPMDEMLRLARLARVLDLSEITSAVIDESMTVPMRTETGADVLLPIRDAIRPIVDELFWPPSPAAQSRTNE